MASQRASHEDFEVLEEQVLVEMFLRAIVTVCPERKDFRATYHKLVAAANLSAAQQGCGYDVDMH